MRSGAAAAIMPTARTRRKHRSKKKLAGKRTNKAAAADRDEEEKREAKKINLGTEQEQQQEEEETVSSAPSSPLSEPYIPDGEYNEDMYTAFELLQQKYEQKIGRQMKLPTLEHFESTTCLADDEQLIPVRESGTRAVLSAAKFLLGLSSSIGGKPLLRCSGFWIDWDEKNNTGIVLTTAHLIRSNRPDYDHWLGQDEYAPDANVIVHLLDDTTAEGHLLYHQEHYDLAFFSVRVDQPVQLPSYNEGVKYAQEVFYLGRDESLNLRINHGRVEYLNPGVHQRYHFMYLSRRGVNEYDDGGPVIDLDGKVVGMVNISTRGSFIPSSILLKCLDLWRKLGCIPRPHLGFKFFAIKLLDPAHVEKIWRKCNIDDGLIIYEVSTGSRAEKLGIRRGDIIGRLNGECISTTVELENMLLSVCKDFDRANQINAEIDVLIWVFRTRKCRWREFQLTVNISDHGEVVARATYPFTTRKGIPASVPPDHGS